MAEEFREVGDGHPSPIPDTFQRCAELVTLFGMNADHLLILIDE